MFDDNTVHVVWLQRNVLIVWATSSGFSSIHWQVTYFLDNVETFVWYVEKILGLCYIMKRESAIRITSCHHLWNFGDPQCLLALFQPFSPHFLWGTIITYDFHHVQSNPRITNTLGHKLFFIIKRFSLLGGLLKYCIIWPIQCLISEERHQQSICTSDWWLRK